MAKAPLERGRAELPDFEAAEPGKESDPWLRSIDAIVARRQEELFCRLHTLLAKPAPPLPEQERAESLERPRLSTSDSELPELGNIERVSRREHPTKTKKRCQVNAMPLLEEEEYEALADERSKLRAARTASTGMEEPEEEKKARWSSGLAQVVNSKNFEGVFAAVIVSNCIFLGLDLEYAAQNMVSTLPWGFKALDYTYAVLFAIELILKICVHGWSFFYIQDRSLMFWNYLDLTIVTTSVVELIFDIVLIFEEDDGSAERRGAPTNLIRIVRIVRVLRVMRVIKVVKFISGLTSLVSSILSTLKSLFWSLVLLLMVIYVFGILFTDTAISHILFVEDDESALGDTTLEELKRHFGSLHLSMHTLFRCVTGGTDWGDMAALLITVDWAWGYLFTGYIAFSYFAVLNVMTAVFCQRAIESAEQDEQNIMQRFVDDQARHRSRIEQLFHTFDGIEKDGAITLSEMEHFFDHEEVRAMFQSLDLTARDSWTLFKLLDEEGNGDINLPEFMDGCMRLRGPAKALDIACVMDESRRIKRKMMVTDYRIRDMERMVTALRERTGGSGNGEEAQAAPDPGAIAVNDKVLRPADPFFEDLAYDVGPHLDFLQPHLLLPGALLT
ncbi:unnamed protein product [Effrenium voratum]|nr:unnamed protein product [Effrenium voratum]